MPILFHTNGFLVIVEVPALVVEVVVVSIVEAAVGTGFSLMEIAWFFCFTVTHGVLK